MNKAEDYRAAVYDFFDGISCIAYIRDVRFVKSTKNRIYFVVGDVALDIYGYNYELAVFVRKKNLSVEIYSEKTGEVETQKRIKHLQSVSNEVWNEYFEADLDEEQNEDTVDEDCYEQWDDGDYGDEYYFDDDEDDDAYDDECA